MLKDPKFLNTVLWLPHDLPIYFVCSFPKSGRTWVRYMLSNYLNVKYFNKETSFQTMYQMCPNCKGPITKTVMCWPGFRSYPDPKIPLVLFCHDLPNPIEHKGHDLIVLIRNPYDTLISYYKHWKYFESDPSIVNFDDYLFNHPYKSIGAYTQWINKWANEGMRAAIEAGNRVLLLTYEGMSNDTLTNMTQVVTFIDNEHSFDEELLSSCVQKGNFENMQKAEVTDGGIYGKAYDTNDANTRRVRKGKVGTYLDTLTLEQYEYIKSKCLVDLNPESRVVLSQTGFDSMKPPSPHSLNL